MPLFDPKVLLENSPLKILVLLLIHIFYCFSSIFSFDDFFFFMGVQGISPLLSGPTTKKRLSFCVFFLTISLPPSINKIYFFSPFYSLLCSSTLSPFSCYLCLYNHKHFFRKHYSYLKCILISIFNY